MMKRNKRITQQHIPYVFIFVFVLAGSACEEPAGIEEHHSEIQHTEPNTIAYFNPQPEPPANIFSIQMMGTPDGNWSGRFMNDYFNGSIRIETLSSKQRGKTMHLVQEWILHPPDPIHPPEPIHPPDPIQPVKITMKGILNMANGKIVMNGKTETNGIMMPVNTNVHLRGEFTATGEQGISVGGELMFNPQPEPPARRR